MNSELTEARFQIFRSSTAYWETLFSHAAEFATQIGRDRLISISHSCDNQDSVVTVWYWAGLNEPSGERTVRLGRG